MAFADFQVQDMLDEQVLRQVGLVAMRLERAAADIRRLQDRGELYQAGEHRHHRIVSAVLSELRAMQGNIMLDALVNAAGDAELHAIEVGYQHA
jgi:hypothetical protein